MPRFVYFSTNPDFKFDLKVVPDLYKKVSDHVRENGWAIAKITDNEVCSRYGAALGDNKATVTFQQRNSQGAYAGSKTIDVRTHIFILFRSSHTQFNFQRPAFCHNTGYRCCPSVLCFGCGLLPTLICCAYKSSHFIAPSGRDNQELAKYFKQVGRDMLNS